MPTYFKVRTSVIQALYKCMGSGISMHPFNQWLVSRKVKKGSTFPIIGCAIALCILGQASFGQNVDERLIMKINPDATTPFVKPSRIVSDAMYAAAVVPAGMMIAGYVKHKSDLFNDGAAVGIASLTSFAISSALKYSVRRSRPFAAQPLYVHDYRSPRKVGTAARYSFPSGHTAEVFALATSLTLACPKWYVYTPAFAFAGTVAYSRMYLGVHYPTDVLMGAFIGTGSSLLVCAAKRRLQR